MSGRFHTASVIAGPKAFAETPRRSEGDSNCWSPREKGRLVVADQLPAEPRSLAREEPLYRANHERPET